MVTSKVGNKKRVDSAKMAKLNIYCILMSDHLRLCQSRLCPRTHWSTRATAFPRYDILCCLTQQTVAEFQTFGLSLGLGLSLSLGQYGQCWPASTASHLGGFPFSYLWIRCRLKSSVVFICIYIVLGSSLHMPMMVKRFSFYSLERLHERQ